MGYCRKHKTYHDGSSCPVCNKQKLVIIIPIVTVVIIGVSIFGYSNYSNEIKNIIDEGKTELGKLDEKTNKIQNMISDLEWNKEQNEFYDIRNDPIFSDTSVSEKYLNEREESYLKIFDKINKIRLENNVNEIPFDDRVYNLAVSRLEDMKEYEYYGHTNPQTGMCVDKIKKEYGLKNNEFVAENLNDEYFNIDETIDTWMNSYYHKINILYPDHVGGAVACDKYCIFLGLNYVEYGKGCY